MCDSGGRYSIHRHHLRRRDPPQRCRSWCCSFAVPPHSPEYPKSEYPYKSQHSKHSQLSEIASKSSASFPNSPQSTKQGLVGRIGPRRILSPGRVSPINSIDESTQEITAREPVPPSIATNDAKHEAQREDTLPNCPSCSPSSRDAPREEGGSRMFDVRLSLKGKNGGSMVFELNSEVLSANSSVFADLIADYRRGLSTSGVNLCRIEVPEVENLGVFEETIQLMFQEDTSRHLMKIGVYRSIDILEVSVGINFTKGIFSCLKYLEAVPWSEEEEEKLRTLFTKFKFDEMPTSDVLTRLFFLEDRGDSEKILARRLVWSIARCSDSNSRTELKSLVKGLLCKSSVYEMDPPSLTTEDMYAVCKYCISQVVDLFEQCSSGNGKNNERGKSLIANISNRVDTINWLVEILLDWQMAEKFVDMWTDQKELLRNHDTASPMVRYELSRVSATLFLGIGNRKLHCRGEARLGLMRAWFGPMLLDFGWLQRCRKGLDMRALEEAMGQTLLTLPLKQQYPLFMEWFSYFSKHGSECPNLSKAFQIWWRRSFLARSSSGSCAVDYCLS